MSPWACISRMACATSHIWERPFALLRHRPDRLRVCRKRGPVLGGGVAIVHELQCTHCLFVWFSDHNGTSTRPGWLQRPTSDISSSPRCVSDAPSHHACWMSRCSPCSWPHRWPVERASRPFGKIWSHEGTSPQATGDWFTWILANASIPMDGVRPCSRTPWVHWRRIWHCSPWAPTNTDRSSECVSTEAWEATMQNLHQPCNLKCWIIVHWTWGLWRQIDLYPWANAKSSFELLRFARSQKPSWNDPSGPSHPSVQWRTQGAAWGRTLDQHKPTDRQAERSRRETPSTTCPSDSFRSTPPRGTTGPSKSWRSLCSPFMYHKAVVLCKNDKHGGLKHRPSSTTIKENCHFTSWWMQMQRLVNARCLSFMLRTI